MEFILYLTIMVIIVSALFGNMASQGAREAGYKEGYEDCARVHNNYEMSPDDDLLMEELKGALKLYIRHHGLYEKGDVKRIEKALDWYDYKHIAWNMTVFRKEKQKNGR